MEETFFFFLISLDTIGIHIYHLAYVGTENHTNKEGLNLNRYLIFPAFY